MIALAAWFVALVVTLAIAMMGHWSTLPLPETDDPRLGAALAAELPAGRWSAVHVLYARCRCSQRIFDHLFTSSRPADVHELLVLVGDDGRLAELARARGFAVISVAPDQLLARFGIESAPLFAVVDPDHAVRYVGGYTARQQGPDIQDLAIIDAARTGDERGQLPVFGCGTSKRLRDLQNPLALAEEPDV